jgi:hypothetical protein
MSSLIEVVLTLVGVLFALALVAQSLQEIVKSGFALKGVATRTALEGLIVEATRAIGKSEQDGRDIVRAVISRLRGVGQRGFRPEAVRLDVLDGKRLQSLITSVNRADVGSLQALGEEEATAQLNKIAEKVGEWFTLSMGPVDDRHRRQMRWLALLSSFVVVVAVNADAGYLLEKARGDPSYRAHVGQLVLRLDSLRSRINEANCASSTTALSAGSIGVTLAGQGRSGAPPIDSSVGAAARRPTTSKQSTLTSPGQASQTTPSTACEALRAQRDSLNLLVARTVLGDSGFAVGRPGARAWGKAGWWLGILISTLLVSLGAPFWHDVLEAVFGLKNRAKGILPGAPNAAGST